MRLLLVSLAFICLTAQISAQGLDLFGRFFGNPRNRCGANAMASSNGRTCLCKPCYTGNPYQGCVGINKCPSRPCGSNAICTNTQGGCTCRCRSGYTGNAYTGCTDINECPSRPCGSNAICSNTQGSYTCRCRSGYTGNANTRCTDINECPSRPCGSNAICSNTQGSYTCRCRSGYTGNANTRCTDINECPSRPCGSNARCSNTQGSYTCRCRSGYTGNANTGCTARPVPTTTQVTIAPRTTPRPQAEMTMCNGKNRTWSKCIGNPSQRFTTDSCTPRSQVCTDGILLGDLFSENFLAESGTAQPEGSRTGTVGGRTFTAQGSTAPGNGSACVREYVRNSQGRIITGRCVPPASAGTNTRRKRQAGPIVQTHRDLLIMLDESFSVGRTRYGKLKRIAAAIVRLLCERIKVHPDYTRVAVTSFNKRVYFNIKLESVRNLRYLDNNADHLVNYIFQNLVFHGGYNARRTCLISSLQHAYNVALDSRYGGRRGDPFVEQDIILISDGCENCVQSHQRSVQIEALTSLFISQGIHVYVIGIGLTDACRETLSLLAQGGRCYHFFYLTEWDYDVDDFIFQLENPPPGVCLSQFEADHCLPPF